MPIRQFFNSWIKRTAEVMFLGDTPPNLTKFYAILANSAAITRDMSMSSVIALELPTTNGYSRQQLIFQTGNYDATDKRYEFPNLNINFVANSNGGFNFQTMIIIANASPTVGNTTGELVAFSTEDAVVSVLANQTQPFVIPICILNTGYVAGV